MEVKILEHFDVAGEEGTIARVEVVEEMEERACLHWSTVSGRRNQTPICRKHLCPPVFPR